MGSDDLYGVRIGLCITGSFCTIGSVLTELARMKEMGADVTAIVSGSVDTMDTRFYTAEDLKERLVQLTGKPLIRSITQAEPIGPKRMFDILAVAPCTGNTTAKIAAGITDTPVTMAVKSHLRNTKPVVLGISTNDGLGNSLKNIGLVLNMKQVYFVPFHQDDPVGKERSLILKSELIIPAIVHALGGRQIQPLLTV